MKHNPPEEILVTEGASDLVAALSLGFYAIGRNSCVHGKEMVLDRVRFLNVVVVADFDKPDANGVRAGVEGARELCRYLAGNCESVKMVFPGEESQDLRSAVCDGLTRERLNQCIESAQEWTPEPRTEEITQCSIRTEAIGDSS